MDKGVSDDLTHAQKPMIAFVDQTEGDEGVEPNATKTMKSCKKIEQWLSSHPYKALGICINEGYRFDVRVYK